MFRAFSYYESVFLLLIVLLRPVSAWAEPPFLSSVPVRVALNAVTFEKFKVYFSEGDICGRIGNIDDVQLDRGGIELILICQVLIEGGIAADIELVPTPNYKRALRMVEIGQVDTVSESVWSLDSRNPNFYASDEVIRLGEFEKGVYVVDGHPLLSIPSEKLDLSIYIGITFKNWFFDWEIVDILAKNTVPIVHLPSLYKMLIAGRGDFTLMEFPARENLEIEADGYIFKPIPKVKVMIPESRVLIVSRNTIYGEKIFNAMQVGVKSLRNKKRIRQLYVDFGFLNSRAKDWRVLNKPEWSETFKHSLEERKY